MSTGKIYGSDELKPAVRGKRRTFLVPLLFFALGALSAFGYFHWYAGRNAGEMKTASSETAKKQPKILYYVDPMNPSNKSDKPGKAPCGMDLVPIYEDEQPSAPEKKQPKILYYVDPMNPSNKSDKPGKAPCGMDLVPVYEEEQPGAGDLPAGTVRISPEKQQMIGVKISEAAEMDISKTIRAVGLAAYDETKVAHVHTKFPGWVDKVYVDFVGKLVKKGQPLLSIYSPDLVSTQQELLIAKKSRDILKSSEFGDIGSRSESLYNATRDRLKYWDISDSQINQIERHGDPTQVAHAVFGPGRLCGHPQRISPASRSPPKRTSLSSRTFPISGSRPKSTSMKSRRSAWGRKPRSLFRLFREGPSQARLPTYLPKWTQRRGR